MTRTLELLDRLVGFPTVSSDSNLALIDWTEAFLRGIGADVHRIYDATGLKAGLFACVGPRGDGGVMLSGHSDVVPVTGQAWTADPFRLRAGGSRVYGRGTTDMKGFVAAMLAAAERAARVPLARPLKLALSWDEEVGCLGIPQMLPSLTSSVGAPQLCIVGEPTSMQVASGHKGKVALRATCHGQGGHSAMAPDFVNAIHIAADFIGGLRRVQDTLARDGTREDGYDIPYATVHAGRIEGGTALNIVPDRAVIDFEYRYPAAQPPGAIQAAIADAACAAAAPFLARFPGARVEVETLNAYPGLGPATDGGAMRLMRRIVPDAGICKVAYGTEAGHFAAAGIASVVCGPGSMAQGHKPDEFIELSELALCDAMLDRLVTALADPG
ncbi:acetylornithine deacetylase [Albidovulum sp.]|uniref:acetylornithine deacetylase n=1 Tax=Albidovulum sp. TaxID=1872424 RepID=UPI001D1C58BE|nr:acetylornithine deacetylase [Paracoccaceae bacterium]MCC0045983.1 acetylornithine deacetylase [Defluviimonas sp.]MCB2134159.1 acetylornithine deacetylase [Paracoccaceae bacterium]MCB2150530.1 acetylornithine deacetylase [Paracoccaceae bacterium]MCP5354499.1 acetylornithine deacetylase [Paracoccaceae bacterium]